MFAYYKTNLLNELKSIKILLVSLIFIITAYTLSYYSNRLNLDLGGDFTVLSLLYGIYAFLTFLFSSILFSGIFSREIENQSIRFITPYLSKKKIYAAKLLTMLTIFAIILTISIAITFIVGSVGSFPLIDTLMFTMFLIYIQAIVIIISLLSPNDCLASIVGLLFSLLMPILFIVSNFVDNKFVAAINWVLPYRYISMENSWEGLILVVLTILLIFLGLVIFERKEI